MTAETVIIEGRHGFHLCGPLALVEEEKEVAWAGAKEFIKIRGDLGWAVANYVSSDPRGNRNGHIFGLEDLQKNHDSVVHTPLNMGHQAQYIVGHHVASELLWPQGVDPQAAAGDPLVHPWVETLSTFYRAIFSEEYAETKKFQSKGMAWTSMEAIPDSLTCRTAGGCGKTFPYAGVQDDSYCAELNEPASLKQLNNPHFVGGAIVIPPLRPGWRRAEVTEVASLVNHQLDLRELYDEMERVAGDNLPAGSGLEQLMNELLVATYGPESAAAKRRKRMQKKMTWAEETAFIEANAKLPAAREPHDFEPAQWTSANDHPRCLLCGREEPMPATGQSFGKCGS